MTAPGTYRPPCSCMPLGEVRDLGGGWKFRGLGPDAGPDGRRCQRCWGWLNDNDAGQSREENR